MQVSVDSSLTYVRNTLVVNMLSYVEHYRPKYMLLENVLGILEWKTVRNVNEVVEMGISKFIGRTMTHLG